MKSKKTPIWTCLACINKKQAEITRKPQFNMHKLGQRKILKK